VDSFNLIWCALWSDYIMTLHQYDTENHSFNVTADLAPDFLSFVSNVIGVQKRGNYLDDSMQTVVLTMDDSEIEALTDWIMNFNFSTRKPAGLPMPDVYLGEEKIRYSAVISYCSFITDFILTMVSNQQKGRDHLTNWAWSNFESMYEAAQIEALKLAKETHQK